MAKALFGLAVEHIDLGQWSNTRQGSCMFLAVATILVDLHLKGVHNDFLATALQQSGPFTLDTCKFEAAVVAARSGQPNIIGRLADILRAAACEEMKKEAEEYATFICGEDTFDRWIEKLQADEFADEHVLRALASLTGLRFQPVKKIYCEFPAHGNGERTFLLGNDALHWVYLRIVG